MANLRELVPDSNPDKDALIGLGLDLTSALVPFAGSFIADVSRGMLDRQAAAQQHEFNVAVVDAFTVLAQSVEGLTAEAILGSSEFVSALAKASRYASESDSRFKRRRLAWAAAQSGPWSDVSKQKRAFFLARAADYSDIHVFLLKYLRDPIAWHTEHSPNWSADKYRTMELSPFAVTDHPLGGKVHYFRVSNRVFSVLDNDYPGASDFEIHEREAEGASPESLETLSGTEERAPSWDDAIAILGAKAMLSIDSILGENVFAGVEGWQELIASAVSDISSDGMVQVSMARQIPYLDALAKHTTPFGDEFLDYLSEQESDLPVFDG
jgi:hypothetical protein